MGELQLREYIRITDTQDPLFKDCREIYENSFPIEEQRSADEQERVFKKYGNFYFYAISDSSISLRKSGIVGFITFWEFGGVLFGEHLAIDDSLRGKDIGGAAIKFLKEKSLAAGKPLILEIEIPTDPLKRRREQFYLRHGFVMNDIKHFQPPFHKGEAPLELLIMSYPSHISQEVYDRFYPEYKAIMPEF